MPSTREKLAKKKSKLARPREKFEEHPANLNNFQEGSFYNIEVSLINPNPAQPRKYFNTDSLEELSQSIKQKGVLQPIIIRRDQKANIYLVAGERRLRAAKMAGLEKIPAILTKGNPVEISLIENLQRDNLKPVEEAEALGRMMEEYNYTQEQVALAIGKARTTITETLSLNKLPEAIKDECRRADIYPRRLLIEIAKQKTAKAMNSLFNRIKEGSLKSEQVRDITRSQSKRSQRTPAAIALNRTLTLANSINKLDLDSIEEKEKVQLITELEQLKKLIDDLLA
jgi:ParB family transcriptional regulator, chromosome partitioning protein